MNIHILISFKILVIEQLRESLTLFWNLLAPVIVFAALNHEAILNRQTLPIDALYPYLSYTVLSMALYSFGIVLLNRREEGFFVSVTHTRISFIRFIALQWLAIYTIFLFAISVLMIIFSMFLTPIPPQTALLLLLYVTVSFSVTSLLFVGLGCLPINQKSAYSAASFIIMIALMMFMFSKSIDPAELSVNLMMLLNPLLLSYFLLLEGVFNSSVFIISFIYICLGSYSLMTFPKQPVFKRA